MAQNDPPQTELTISAKTFVKILLLIVATILTLSVLRQTAHSLVIIFVAFFLALALNAPVSFLARHMPGKIRGSRAWATSLAFLIVVLLLGGFIASSVPSLVRQTQNLVNAAPGLIQDIRDQKGPVGGLVRRYHLQSEVSDVSTQLSNRLKGGAGTAFSTVQKVGSSAFALLTVLALTFMMLVEGPKRLEFLYELVPDNRKAVAKRTALDMYRVIKGYVNGQVILAAIAAGFVSLPLFFFHIDYAVGLIVVVFICGLIPMVGHTLGAIIVTLVALLTSPTVALIILLYYFSYQQIENYLIQPRIQANSTDMSPLLVFASVVIGVSFSGLLGGLVAIPIAGCIRIALLEYLRSKQLINAPVVKQEIRQATSSAK